MPATLDQLSENEIQIFNEAKYQQRYTGTRLVDTSDTWLFKDYKSIHDEYLNLYNDTDDTSIKLEALKRMVFLNWYGLLEPEYLTGISDLNKITIIKSYEILNSYIEENKIDKELNWMLWFYCVWDFLITPFAEGKLNELMLFISKVDPNVLIAPKKSFDKGVMDNRGQMGIYWKSIVEKD